ncbi:MAG: hypothetical protein ACRD5B_05270 [Nitrososphaeraceae archaeon]
MTFQQNIIVLASVIIIEMATAVSGLVFNLFASTIRIPTYDKTTFLIADPNDTTTFDYPDGLVVISVP